MGRERRSIDEHQVKLLRMIAARGQANSASCLVASTRKVTGTSSQSCPVTSHLNDNVLNAKFRPWCTSTFIYIGLGSSGACDVIMIT